MMCLGRDTLTTAVPEIKEGYMTIPAGPGWGTDALPVGREG